MDGVAPLAPTSLPAAFCLANMAMSSIESLMVSAPLAPSWKYNQVPLLFCSFLEQPYICLHLVLGGMRQVLAAHGSWQILIP
jgi:hypothetical protein